MTIADDMDRINYVEELNVVINASDLKKHIDETFQEVDFSVKEFRTEDYPKNSQAYLNEAEFYCRKAREYRAKKQAAATQVDAYIELGIGKNEHIMEQYEQVSATFRKVEKDYSEVFYYCLQEAVYWKLKAEIYNNCDQDKKRIEDPTRSSSCKIHSQNDVTQYIYVPTDKKNSDKAKFVLELTKVGLGARNGVDNVMLVVKEIEECKEQNTLDMMERLSFYGGEFMERGIVMVTEMADDEQLFDNQPIDSDEKYFINEAKSESYSDLFEILAKEKRIFGFDKKKIDTNEWKMTTEWGEYLKHERVDDRWKSNFQKINDSAKIVRRANEGVKHRGMLTETGMNMYRDMYTASKGMDVQVDRRRIDEAVMNRVWETIGYMGKIKLEEGRHVEEKRRIETKRRYDIQEKQILEQAERDRLERERKRQLEIELERRRLEEEERERRRREERERERERENRERQRKLMKEIEALSEELRRIQRNGDEMLSGIKEWLDNYKNKDHPRYLEIKKEYERLMAVERIPLRDDDPEKLLAKCKQAIINEELWNMSARSLTREQVEVANIIAIEKAEIIAFKKTEIIALKKTVGDGGPVVVKEIGGVGAAIRYGADIGSNAGPIGTVVGGAVGGAVGLVGKLFSWW